MTQENLFNFDYEVMPLLNKDNSASRFSAVYGEDGNIIHTKKDTYTLVSTQDLSMIGNAFIERGKDVSTFTHRGGEVIGLNINFGEQLTNVGDKSLNALITVPNNGGGQGFLSIKEMRLVCTNGMVRTATKLKEKSIKIPHTIYYEDALKLMELSLIQFEYIINMINDVDTHLSKQKLSELDVRFLLNKWFYEKEMPLNHKNGIAFNDFRRMLVESPHEIKTIDRYNQLMTAFDWELQYNSELDIQLSQYTVVAVVNNYLSRRIEASKSVASQEIQFARQSEKINNFDFSLAI